MAGVSLLGLAGAACLGAGSTPDARHRCLPIGDPPLGYRPNFVLVMADDLGYGDLGSYGQTRIDTGHLDRLASQGLRFTEAYSGSTVCRSARNALMTGMHTGHTTIRGNKRQNEIHLRPEDVTVAEVLRCAGYETAVFGKWAMGQAGSTGEPNRKGFDHFLGYLDQTHAHDYYPTFLYRDGERFSIPENEGSAQGRYSQV